MAFQFRLNLRSQILAPTLTVLLLALPQISQAYDLTILHTNDVHDRMEQFDVGGGSCSEDEALNGECYGGVARRATMINNIRETVDNVLFLDAGDQFQGTNWFFLYQGSATSYFMNKLGYDAQALGNHEFDLTPDGLAPFLKDVQFPVISCNTDASEEPVIDGLFNKSVVLTVGGEQIGVVGYTYSRTSEISQSRKTIFHDEIESLQVEVNRLTSQGINKIIAVGHSGITKDLEIAAKVKGVDIVVGGHTDTFCTPPDREVPYGEYPTVVTPDQDPDGTVLVVTDYTFAKYLGRLDIVFDDLGRVTEWSGNPILLNKEVEEDPEVLAEINEWGEAVRNLTKERIGSTHVYLDGARESCRLKECNLGNMIADAYIWIMVTFPDEEKWNDVSIAIQNSGGIRSSIAQGDVTFGDVTTVLPFGSTVDTVELEGRYVKEMLENSVAEYSPVDLPGRFLQMSGMWVTYDISRGPNDRVVDVQVRCTECNIPEYLPLEENKLYKMVMPSFVADGGDGYDMIKEHGQNRYSGNLDTNVISDYIEKFSPIYSGIERRITFATDRATSIVPKSSIFGILLVASRLVFPLLWS
ncbi:snake venom 5'-nucleotidase-like [Amphiura filiformis]|uniref:snake venom 5'-nucleotidase-like n=1 Tax=Amphiura filiformis TaxID=82378 RepID=UPI003B213D04